ncbi:MAG: membrane protein insertion efficiency factor YidD [Janibacter sp.]|nr:membrane protein insertion efficiency factor YidD [Janibacter sp.]
MTILALPLVWLVRGYQLLVSPLLPQTCRYFPSCSAYGLTSLRRFGLIRGSYLTVHRLVRCNPWSAGGIDHVPETWAQRGSPDLARPRFADIAEHDDGVDTDVTERRTFTT